MYIYIYIYIYIFMYSTVTKDIAFLIREQSCSLSMLCCQPWSLDRLLRIVNGRRRKGFPSRMKLRFPAQVASVALLVQFILSLSKGQSYCHSLWAVTALISFFFLLLF